MQAATRSARSSVVRGPTEAWERVAAPHAIVVVMVDQTSPLSILRAGASWSIGAAPTLGTAGPPGWALRHSRPVIPVTGRTSAAAAVARSAGGLRSTDGPWLVGGGAVSRYVDRRSAADVLRRTELFGALDNDVLDRLAAASRSRAYGKGQYIWYQGDPGDTLLVVCEGRVKVV